MDDDAKQHLSKKSLSIRDVLKEGWQLTSGLKWPVSWLSFLVTVLLILNVFLFFISVIPLLYYFMARHLTTAVATGVSQGLQNVTVTTSAPSIMPSFLITIPLLVLIFIFYLLIWFIGTMLVMLGVRRSIGLAPEVKIVFRDCKNVLKPLLGIFLIIVALSIVLFIGDAVFKKIGIIGILINVVLKIGVYYVSWSMSTFAVPLIVTKRYPTLLAFKVGFRAMNLHWKVIVPTYIIMLFIAVISAIPLGIGLIWTIPMFLAISGIFFRDIFGLQKKVPANSG